MFPAPPRPPFPPPCMPPPVHVPVGAVVAFMGQATAAQTAALARAGWMICDGTSVSRSMYPELFAVIGYLYSGSGAQGEQFLLPDLRGYFLRGVDGDSGHDPDAGDRTGPDGQKSQDVGSLQKCALQAHQHDYDQAQAESTPSDAGVAGVVTVNPVQTKNILPDTVLTSKHETRPVNVYVYYLIKFTTGAWPWAPPFDGGLGG